MAQKKAAPRAKSKLFTRKKAAKPERYTKAVEAFERAVKTLHKGDADKARGQFEAILSDVPDDREITDRVQSYISICDRQRKSRSSFSPRTFEELVTYGVFWHNQGDFDRAIKYLSKAVDTEPRSDHAHYCLAAAYSRHGDSRDATRHLKQALAGNPYNRVLAKWDEDFASLREEGEVAQLLASPD